MFNELFGMFIELFGMFNELFDMCNKLFDILNELDSMVFCVLFLHFLHNNNVVVIWLPHSVVLVLLAYSHHQ